MTTPFSPKLLKGAIVGIDLMNPLASIVIFQYNPETLTRQITAQLSGGEGGANRAEPTRIKGAPVETITLDVEIDATDQLETGNPIATTLGIHPQLAAIEMLVYPKTLTVIANTALLLAGTIEIVQPEAPFTLFIWGPGRVVPVRLSSFTITEQAHDQLLNPIRAKASLSLRVLSYNDFPVTHPGYALFLAHQVSKEVLAVIGSVGNVAGSVSVSASVSVG